MIKILFLIAILVSYTINQKAILMSSSLGYYNIRQISNIVKVYQHLRSNGYKDDDILLLIAEIQTCCQKNHMFGQLSYYDGDYNNIFRNIQIDYSQSQLTMASVAEILMGFYSPFTLNKKKFKLQPSEPLFVYVTGHGGDTYFKIREREALIDEQFVHIFNILRSKTDGNFAVISDSCSAITPFEKVTTDGFIALGSSSFEEKSLSHGYDIALNQPKTDDFSFYFDEVLSGKAILKGVNNLESWTFKDLQKYMDFDKLKVHSKLIANKISKSQKLLKFLSKPKVAIKFKSHKKNFSIQNFFAS